MTRFCQTHAYSLECHDDIRASISRLFGWSSPFAIILAIATRTFNSLNGMTTRGLQSHVDQEQLKVMPSLTDGNSPTTISREMCNIGILTPSQHVLPCSVFRGYNVRSLVTMFV
jgi:hypothetical protein